MNYLVKECMVSKVRLFLRSSSYSSALASVFLLLIFFNREKSPGLLILTSILGLFLVFVEAVFIVKYVRFSGRKRRGVEDYNFLHHSFNHVVYPLFFYVGLSVYIFFEENAATSLLITLISFLLFLIHFYYLPQHLLYGHLDSKKPAHVEPIVDLGLALFKLFGYFVVNIALFQLYFQSLINLEILFGVNFFINFLYLFFHLNRKELASGTNLLVAVLFALVTSIFILRLKVNATNFTASIATLVFYLSSSIFYHKADGTLDYKVLIEYSSIALMLSIFLFSI